MPEISSRSAVDRQRDRDQLHKTHKIAGHQPQRLAAHRHTRKYISLCAPENHPRKTSVGQLHTHAHKGLSVCIYREMLLNASHALEMTGDIAILSSEIERSLLFPMLFIISSSITEVVQESCYSRLVPIVSPL